MAFLYRYPAINNKNVIVYISLAGMRLITTENEKILSKLISKKSAQTVQLTGSKLSHKDNRHQRGITKEGLRQKPCAPCM